LVTSFVIAGVLLTHASAGPMNTPDQTATLQVGVVESTPGTEARVGLVLFLADEGPPPRAIHTRVCFSEAVVRLRGMEDGPAVRAGGARVEQKTDRQQDTTCANLQFDLERPIESGTLADLVFEVPGDAPIDSVVELNGDIRLTGPEGTIPAAVRHGSIKIVERTPIFACYFYMH
jgi:hypothetical protein